MKKIDNYKILHFSFTELYSNADIQESDHSLMLSSADLTDILLSKIPYYLRGAVSCNPSVRELAENAAINIPANAILRLMRSLLALDKKNPFLYTLIYVDIGSAPVKNQIEHLVNGLTLCLSENEKDRIRFVPFERSASQTRNNQLVMIDQNMKTDDLEQAIRCGTGENVQVNSAKWAAYRALLLSSGVPFNHEEAEIELNENTVIVVPDYKYEMLINAQTAILGNSDEPDPIVRTTSGKGSETKCIKYDIMFDGEGFISASWALKIAEQIIDKKESVKPEDISSFQIRLPFTKGLLHKVDFHALFREIFGDEQELYIRDVYDKPRKLSNVQIILSKSMFKAGSVIGNSESYSNFWKAFQTQQHRLYIANCDASMTNSEQRQTITNYQFFSTLNFGDQQKLAKDIIRPALAAVLTAANSQDSTVISYLMRAKKDLATEDDFVQDEAADAAAAEPDEITDAMLLQKCPELARNTVFFDIMDKLSMQDSCSIGRLYTAGSLLYLSGDLVQMALLLARDITDGITDRNIEPQNPELLRKLCKETMCPERAEKELSAFYYAPGVPDLPCILNRNPHLSRQEHVYANPIKAGAFRKKYFSHLKGVCMVRHDIAFAAQRLGGADYDGDLVRLFYDPSYIAAAKGGMQLPALCIPSKRGTPTDFNDETRKKLLLDSAQNRVGLFSNAGFYSSLFSYQYRQSSLYTADIAEQAAQDIVHLSVITGLEIDAAKTGVKPNYAPSELVFTQQKKAVLEQLNKKESNVDPYQLDFFIRFKEMMKGSQRTTVDMHSLQPKKDKSLGEYSPVEVLPYIFRPSLVTLKESASDILPEWSKICHQILWDERGGKYSTHISKEIAIKYPKSHLHDLVTSGNSQVFTEEQTVAVREAVLAEQTFWSLCQFNLESSEKSYYLNCMRRKLYQICGLKQSKKYIRILEKFSEHFHDLETLLSDFFRIVPWRNLENSWLRYQRFSMKLLEKYHFWHENVNEFEKLFELSNTDSVETDKAKTETKESIDLLPAILRASLNDEKEAFLQKCGPVIDAVYQGAKQNEMKQLAWKFCQDVIQPLMKSNSDAPEELAEWIENCDSDLEQKNWVTMSQEERNEFIQSHFAWENDDPDTQKALQLLKDPKYWSLLPYFMRYCIVTTEKHRRAHCQKELRQNMLNFFSNILKKETIQTDRTITKEEFEQLARLILERCGGHAITEAFDMQHIFDFDAIEFDREHQYFIFKKRNSQGTYDQSGRVSARSLLWFGLLYCLKTDGFSAAEKVRALFLNVTGINDHKTFLRSLLNLTNSKLQCQKIGFKNEKDRDEFVFRFYKQELYRILKPTPSAFSPVKTDYLPPDVGYLDGCQGFCIESSLEQKTASDQDETPEITIRTLISDKLPASPDELLQAIRQAVTVPESYQLTVLPKEMGEGEAKLLYERLRVQRLVALPFIILRNEQEVLHGYVTYLWIPVCLKGKNQPLEKTITTMPINRHGSKKQHSEPLPYFLYGYQMFQRSV